MASESFFDAWERYKALLRSYPCHNYFDYTQISMFIKGTIDEYRRMINTSAGGYYVNRTTTKVKKIIEDVAAVGPCGLNNLKRDRLRMQKKQQHSI